MAKTGVRNGNKHHNNKKTGVRKEFRKQQRKLRKKSKNLARQFGQQHRQSKLITVKAGTFNGNEHPHKQQQRKQKKMKKANRNTDRNVHFAMNPIWDSDDEQPAQTQFVDGSPKSILKTSDSFVSHTHTPTPTPTCTHQQQPQQQQQQQQQPTLPDDNEWVDERDERWIKALEQKLGFKQRGKGQYWKRQEFVQDGLDCFFDLEYFSDESEVGDEEKERYNEYFELRKSNATPLSASQSERDAFKEQHEQTACTADTDKSEIRKSNATTLSASQSQRDTFKEHEQSACTADTDKSESDSVADKARTRKQKMEIYGQDVNDSDDEGDTAIRNFLEDDVYSDCVELDDNVNGNGNGHVLDKHAKGDAPHGGASKYVPPQLRKLQLSRDDDASNTATQLKRQLGAHLNRLLSNNLPNIANVVNAYYCDDRERYSKQQVTTALCECVRSMIDKEEETPALNSIILCVSALITAVYCTNGVFVGSNIVELLTSYFNDDFERMSTSKIIHHLLRLQSYLYLFGMIGAKYLIEILLEFVRRCDAATFSALAGPMLICGVELRNTDPITFKQLIVLICDTSKTLLADAADAANSMRTKHCLDIERTMQTVFAIKDNKACNALTQKSSISQYTAHCGTFKRLKLSLSALKLKHATSSTSTDMRLAMSYTDIMNIARHGRWWLPGAPVKGGVICSKLNGSNRPTKIWKSADAAYSFPDQLLSMSKKFHMNTPIRRAIFCMVMDSDDYVDAYQKLMQLNMSDGQHTEIIRIVLLLCLRQTLYNPYYALLLGKLIQAHRGWKFSLHCACWDKFAELDEMPTSDIVNLAKLLADMLHLRSLNLVVLKRLDIMKTSPQNVLFVHTVFTTLLNKNLSSTTNNALNDVFASLQGNQQLMELKQDIEMFFHTVLIPRTKTQIAALKKQHQNAQQMVQKNKMHKQELINVGLKLRQQENFLIIAKNALSAAHDYQLKTSMYNHLIS
eukprot:CAMPEP_0202729492 /NCGR_PEP_ID=MMETSP1385-20130828/186158_1 /ASSEMBLY_ACC=CAM_ASM_000861 /TAXON_ID=933848 /ORGANISM="Elphidium margaritaceum" /LENGTH=967 /DNA_ID=CAMNT_0049395755 /DNA_START=31 /DNA_END=2934 /DNA_ORIENTATION=-